MCVLSLYTHIYACVSFVSSFFPYFCLLMIRIKLMRAYTMSFLLCSPSSLIHVFFYAYFLLVHCSPASFSFIFFLYVKNTYTLSLCFSWYIFFLFFVKTHIFNQYSISIISSCSSVSSTYIMSSIFLCFFFFVVFALTVTRIIHITSTLHHELNNHSDIGDTTGAHHMHRQHTECHRRPRQTGRRGHSARSGPVRRILSHRARRESGQREGC